MTFSTFHGLEVAKKALFAQQRGLYTTGHNISNVNTDGYSRQRVNFETSIPYPPRAFYKPKIPGQFGTGVEIGTIQRIRDEFLDFQYRIENSRASYWEKRSEALSRMEELLNEPSENGLSKTLDQFWQALQDLTDDVQNPGARSVVAQRALAFAETFNYYSRSLQSIQTDLKEQIDVNVGRINSLVRQINAINEQIVKIEPHGMLPNDLYDERDRLIDELSEFVNIKVHYTSSSPGSLEIADGLASIELLDDRGHSIGDGVFLLDIENADSIQDAINELTIGEDADTGAITGIYVEGHDDLNDLSLLQSTGRLKALIETYGYIDDNGEVVGDYPEMLANLNQMANAFAEAFNAQHAQGVNLSDDGVIPDFFVTNDGSAEFTAENITVNKAILDDPNLIAASLPGEGSQNANNALELAKLFDEGLEGLDGASVRSFYTKLIGELGVEGQEASRMVENTNILRAQVHDQRRSVSAVSLDEEMTNLIKFQHAYNAAARSMTTLDEMLDRIINNMGLVGR